MISISELIRDSDGPTVEEVLDAAKAMQHLNIPPIGDLVSEKFTDKLSRRDKILKKVLDNCVRDENGCMIWQGGHSGNGRGGGYGRVCIDGATVATHRLVYVHFNGIIPPKKQVDHTCGNRLCCNPNHLELVTHKENQKRRSRRMKGTD